MDQPLLDERARSSVSYTDAAPTDGRDLERQRALSSSDEDELVCRICHDGQQREGLVELQCACKNGLRWMHASCGERWFGARDNASGRCEMCKLHAFDVSDAARQRAQQRQQARHALHDRVPPPPFLDGDLARASPGQYPLWMRTALLFDFSVLLAVFVVRLVSLVLPVLGHLAVPVGCAVSLAATLALRRSVLVSMGCFLSCGGLLALTLLSAVLLVYLVLDDR